MNALREGQGNFVMAVDIPSGLGANCGQVMGLAVEADLTATFGLPKPGLLLYPGRAHAGHIEVIDIGFPRHVLAHAGLQGVMLTDDFVRPVITPRTSNSHKGTYGHTLVLAGAPGKSGAAILAGAGAIRAGAGLVTVGTHAQVVPQIATLSWELMAEPVYGLDDAPDDVLRELITRLNIAAVAIGPGLGTRFQARRVLDTLLKQFTGPCVLDADALNMIAKDVSLLDRVADSSS